MEGSENLRQRGNRRKPQLKTSLNAAIQLDDSPPSPSGEQVDTMAAGSSRIIRYVLFAFFVSCSATCLLI